MSDEKVSYRIENGTTAVIELRRSGQGNVIDLETAQALDASTQQAASAVRDGEARAVVIRATGKQFCLGGDLREFNAAADPSAHISEVAKHMHAAISALNALPAPVISAVHGVAAGGGVGWALAGDIVVISSAASFVGGYVAAGLSPDCGTSWVLTQQIGTARAMDFFLTGRNIPAAEALALGLVSRVADPDDFEAEVDALIAAVLAQSLPAAAATKGLLRNGRSQSFDAALADEAASIGYLAGTPDGREGVAAFLERRKPVYATTATAPAEARR